MTTKQAGKESAIKQALSQVIDPELNLNIVEIGLVYKIKVDEKTSTAYVDVTLTSPACPVGPQILANAEKAVQDVPGIEEAVIKLVWSPPWNPEMMSEEARLKTGMV